MMALEEDSSRQLERCRCRLVVTRDLLAGLRGGQSTIDLRPLYMLARAAFSCHDTHPNANATIQKLKPHLGSRYFEISRFRRCIPQHNETRRNAILKETVKMKG